MSAVSELSKLLAVLFKSDELDFLLNEMGWPDETVRDVQFSLPSGVGRRQLAYELVGSLSRRGLIDANLFQVLEKERALEAEEIRRVEKICREAFPRGWSDRKLGGGGGRGGGGRGGGGGDDGDSSDGHIMLFLGVPQNRRGEARLRVDEEHNRITTRLDYFLSHDILTMESRWAVNERDLFVHMARFDDAKVFHFSGHCREDGRIVIHASTGAILEVSVAAMVDGLREMSPDFIFLNACFSDQLGEALVAANVGRCIIAMNDEVHDQTSITLADQFYAGIAQGMSIGRSFRLAQVAMTAFERGADVPVLLRAEGVNPVEEFLFRDGHEG